MPVHYLSAIIAVVSLAGTYILRENIWDVVLVVLLGVLGFGMRRAGIPVLPLVIGFVLGSLAEKSFLLTVRIHDGQLYGVFRQHHLLDPHPYDGGGSGGDAAADPLTPSP